MNALDLSQCPFGEILRPFGPVEAWPISYFHLGMADAATIPPYFVSALPAAQGTLHGKWEGSNVMNSHMMGVGLLEA